MTTLRPPVTVRIADPQADFAAILGLYRAHGWSHATDPERLRRAVEHSAFAVVAVAGEKVIGFARCLSDEAFAVYIADILVAPDRQREGVGRRLVRAIMDRYPLDRYHHQVLVAERGVEGFYRRMGLVPISAYGLTAFIRARQA